jgi:hypothetical protein
MRALIGAVAALGATTMLGSCEGDASFRSGESVGRDIIRAAESICGENREGIHGGVINIMLMEGRQDDGVVTCFDGHNEPFDA